jgi:hypothetical protein
MPYIGKKPADIIATVIDTTTGTFSGEVDAGSLDVSGNADIDGVTNLDNTDIDGTLDVSGNLTVDTNTLYVDSANNRVGVGTVSPSDLLELSGSTAQPAIRLNDTDVSGLYHRIFTPTNTGLAISADTGNVASDSFLRFDVDGTERARIDSSGNLLVGKTTTAFGTAGVRILPTGNIYPVADGSVPLEINRLSSDGGIINLYKDGTTVGSIGTTSGDFILDTTSSIILDAGGDGQIELADTGTTFGILYDTSSNFGIYSAVQDKDIIFQGNDGGSTITALTLDMSDAGTAIFNHDIKLNDAQLIRFGSSQDSDIAHYADNQLAFRNTTGTMTFYTGPTPTERMKLDANGNLLVDTTSTTIIGNGGFALKPQGSGTRLDISNHGGATMLIERRASDGDIVGFYKDGSAVGSIGVQGARLTIGNDAVGLRFHGTNGDIYPWNMSTNAINNGGIDLGSAGGRFKDLYLSGGVYLGGTGSANKLDDYEEGTWTPNIGGTATYTSQFGIYTKVGNVVTCQFRIHINNLGTGSTTTLSGFPFADASDAQVQSGHCSFYQNIAVNTIYLSFYIENNATTALFVGKSSSGSTADNAVALFGNSANVYGQITYRTA